MENMNQTNEILTNRQLVKLAKEVKETHYDKMRNFIELQNRWEEGQEVKDGLLALNEEVLPLIDLMESYKSQLFLNLSLKKEWYENYFYSFYSDYTNMQRRIQYLLAFIATDVNK